MSVGSFAEFPGYARLHRRFESLGKPDPSDLLREWGKLIVEDNRAGVLAGIDKDGVPAPPLKYRGGSGTPTRFRKRTSQRFGTTAGRFKGMSSPGAGNLTHDQYKRLTGPRLAPRRSESRAITNLTLREPYQDASGTWWVEAYWADVVSSKGRPFLRFHFNGTRWLPKYDLRGVRPQGKQMAMSLLRKWLKFPESFAK